MIPMILVLLVFLIGVYWWSNRKSAVPYRPSREDVLILLRKVLGGLETEVEWETFTSVPIDHDPNLEEIRKRSASVTANPAYSTDLKEGFIFNEQGMNEIKSVIAQLEGYCKAKGREKSDFQKNCAQILEHKMQLFGLKFSKWDFIEGLEESYYLGEIKGVQVYVYGDGASIKSPQGAHMFDNSKYKGENELVRAVVGKLSELVSGAGPG